MKTPLNVINELMRIVSGAINLDAVKVRNYTAFLADKLEAEGEKGTADRLRKILTEADRQLRPADISARTIPVDGESRFSLLEEVNLAEDPTNIVLTQKQEDIVNEFISLCKAHAQLEVHGIDAPSTLLLYGPPGCGKSHLARYIARELGLKLYLARLDGLISSYLGNTSKNIRAIFEFAVKNPGVLLLDEFDAIAKLRDDKQELGELKRVVNSFLQSLDYLGSRSIVIAATNHQHLLDSAVWRRFNYTLQIAYPNYEERRKIWIQNLIGVTWPQNYMEVLVDLTEGFSGAEIKDVCLRLRRQEVISGKKISISNAFACISSISSSVTHQRSTVLMQLKDADLSVVALHLRNRNKKLYTSVSLGKLLEKSPSTIHRILSQKGKGNAAKRSATKKARSGTKK